MLALEGKSIIVTGGGSGIGRATALLLGEAGAGVTVADRNPKSADAVATEIVRAGGRAEAIAADVRFEADAEAIVDRAVSAFGGLNGAANCAGYPQHTEQVHNLTLDQWRDCIDINLTGVFLCVKHQLRAMLNSGGGSIVVVSSTAATRGFPLASEYAASKSGLLGFVRCVAYEYGKQGIRVNAVLPGGTDTPMLRGKMDETPGLEELISAQHLLGRFAQPQELGTAIRWLLSEEASFVTGIVMPVDGGQTAG
jgi:2,5-dichloro-2,5-cyclohexadiene-1,4-diol dehydrogenase 1